MLPHRISLFLTSKTVNGVKHTYTLEGSRIVMETWGTQMLVYIYDDEGMPIGMMYRKNSYEEEKFDYYLFEKDAFGNIVAVYNEAGTKVAKYCYDAWGNCTVLTNTNGIGAMNPFRYRGYYLDTETNLYYLQTRYYDSYVGRFINSDSPANLSAGDELLSYNLFSYCFDNPVMGYDPTGTWDWNKFFSGANLLMVGVAAVAIAATVLTCGAAAPVMAAVAAVTLVTGAATVVNGVAEIVEAGTGYNVVRDGIFDGNPRRR